jgi:hypothetical protein
MASDFVHTQVVRVPGGWNRSTWELNRRMLPHMLYALPRYQVITAGGNGFSKQWSVTINLPGSHPPKVLEKQKIKHKFLGVDHSKQCLQKRFTGVLGTPPCIISASPIICSNALPIKPFPICFACTHPALPFRSAAFRARPGNGRRR